MRRKIGFKLDLHWHFRSYVNDNGVLIRIPSYIQYYTPKEWFEALFDLQEITEHYVWYQDYVYAIAFYRYKFRKKLKYYEHETIRLHRKLVCKYIAPDPEIKIYEGERLEQWKEELAQAVYETFNYQTRSASFRNIKVKGRCLNCSIILSESNRNSWRYCSEECRNLFYLEFDFNYNKNYVWLRDRGICQICKKSTRFISEIKSQLWFINQETKRPECDQYEYSGLLQTIESEWIVKFERKRSTSGEVFFLPYTITINEYDSYEIDHIKEVSTGNNPEEQVKLFLDYTNMQTLCIPCHKQKTANFLRKRFSKKRKTKSKKVKEFI